SRPAQIMKASLFAEDEDDSDMFQHHRGMKMAADVSSPRLVLPGQPGRPSVGGLLQARFSSGLFPQRSDSPRLLTQSSPAPADPPRALQWKSPGPASILLPPRVSEPAIRTVGVRRMGGPVPLQESVTQGKGALLMDTGLFATRSFRVGWGPGWTLVHCGSPLSAPAAQQLGAKTDFSFLPKPPRDHRLSLLLSQAVGSRSCRQLLALQLADWNQMHMDRHLSQERLRIFALLAGKAVWQSSDSAVNVCSDLDWKRCLAVHLWFMLPPTASVADALAKYQAAFQVSSGPAPYACAPLPPYQEGAPPEEEEEEEEECERPLYDLCFHLLKLYSDRHYSLQPLLDPLTVTWRRLDFRLSWHLWGVLQALHYSHLSAARQGLVHASYAAQLENCIINDNHDYLLEFLEGLAVPEHSASIQDWDTAGRVYLDYIRVIKSLQDIQQVRPAPEMAKRVANILRVVLSLQQGDGGADPLSIPLAQLVPHISRLPMPEDYTLEELRGLTQSYLQQLVIGQ
uniref:Nucleoporin 98 n=1 Tax=Fundulus heteroclitus TaxID=8078 RepID=A0A3Q2QJK1_FUNHE